MSKPSITQEINLGAPVCVKIKDFYYPDVHWSKCGLQVADKFAQLKKITQTALPDKTMPEILRELAKYTNQDIGDIFG